MVEEIDIAILFCLVAIPLMKLRGVFLREESFRPFGTIILWSQTGVAGSEFPHSISGEIEVEKSVAVVVGCRDRDHKSGELGVLFYLLKPGTGIFEIGAVFGTSSQNEIGVTVVVKISEDAAGRVSFNGQFPGFGDFLESAIAPVPKEKILSHANHDVEIVVSVLIDIDNRDARFLAHCDWREIIRASAGFPAFVIFNEFFLVNREPGFRSIGEIGKSLIKPVCKKSVRAGCCGEVFGFPFGDFPISLGLFGPSQSLFSREAGP